MSEKQHIIWNKERKEASRRIYSPLPLAARAICHLSPEGNLVRIASEWLKMPIGNWLKRVHNVSIAAIKG